MFIPKNPKLSITAAAINCPAIAAANTVDIPNLGTKKMTDKTYIEPNNPPRNKYQGMDFI